MSSHRKKSRKKTDTGPGGRRRSRSAEDYTGHVEEVGTDREKEGRKRGEEGRISGTRIFKAFLASLLSAILQNLIPDTFRRWTRMKTRRKSQIMRSYWYANTHISLPLELA